MPQVIGFTSTIPVEAVYASGNIPCDINNLFITAHNPPELVNNAKKYGFPDTTCSWICGLFSAVLEYKIKTVIGVFGGDCSETIALMEVLQSFGVNVIPFNYPHIPNETHMRESISQLCSELGTNYRKAEEYKYFLDNIRNIADNIDYSLWNKKKGDPFTVQLIQLGTTDFEGDPVKYKLKCDDELKKAENSDEKKLMLRIGIVGVPTIISNLYSVIEQNNAFVVYSEVQRQFSIPYRGTIESAYTKYTYPYGIYYRINDIQNAISERKLDGIIHYVQSFCYRSIEDIVLRKNINIPILTLQGDLPTAVTETMEIRIEAFLDMLERKKRNC